jgi:glycosyl transferase family protein with helical bundle domain
MIDEDKLRAFGRLVVRLQRREDLSREEVREAYRQIWRNEQPELQQGAFIAALRQKGETAGELTGVVEAFQDEWRSAFPHVVEAPEGAPADPKDWPAFAEDRAVRRIQSKPELTKDIDAGRCKEITTLGVIP